MEADDQLLQILKGTAKEENNWCFCPRTVMAFVSPSLVFFFL